MYKQKKYSPSPLEYLNSAKTELQTILHQTSYGFVFISVNDNPTTPAAQVKNLKSHCLFLFFIPCIQSTSKFCQLCLQNMY